MTTRRPLGTLTALLLGLSAWGGGGRQAIAQPPAPPAPTVTITLGSRQARAVPLRQGFTHTGGGNIDVAQPAPDTLVVTMTGVAVAGGHPCQDSVARMTFELEQCFEVRFEDPKVKRARLTLEGRVIGLLRTHKKGGGSAAAGPAHAVVTAGPAELLTVGLPPHSVAAGENLSVNDHEGPFAAPVQPGPYVLHQAFEVSAMHARALLPCKAASAEFAPDPALDPLWISYWEPFHGAIKKDFGFQVVVKVAPEEEPNDKKNGKP
jgi:hypothetical protein